MQDTAGYGFVIVTKPLSILSPYGVYAGISVFAGNDGVTINAPGGGVRLTGVYINGQGGSIGINVQNASKVTVEGSSVTNMASHGLSATSASARIVIRNTVFRDNGGYGVSVAGAAGNDDRRRSRRAERARRLLARRHQRDGLAQRHERQRRARHLDQHAVAHDRATISISDHASANNAGSGIEAAVFSAASVYVTVSRSALSGNTQHGAHATTSGQGTARITLSYSEVMANGVSGVTAEVGKPRSRSSTATRSRRIRWASRASSLAVVRSAGNNSIIDNTTNLGAGYATYAPN